jgi:molecular chaperone DnaJ
MTYLRSMPEERDLYEILGVPRTASADELKSAYRRLARKHHPDVNPGDKSAEDKFKVVAAAFDVIGNPDKRKLYDELGPDAQKIGFDPEKAKAYREYKAARERTGGGASYGGGEVPFDLGDIFGDIFGGAGRGGQGGPRQARGGGPQPGEDIEASIEIDLADAVRGAERRLSLSRPERCGTCDGKGAKKFKLCPQCKGSGTAESGRGSFRFSGVCPTCQGSGQIPEEPCKTCRGSGVVQRETRLDVKIPKGAVTGTVIRLAGQGAAGTRGGPPGDVLLEVKLRPHPLVRLDGHDLSFDLPITVGEAVAGSEVTIPTFEGDVKLKVPAASQSGRKLRLRGKGLPNLRGGRGDLYAVVQVIVPESGSGDEEVRKAAAELDRHYGHDVRRGLQL